jgi:hypothetical protein
MAAFESQYGGDITQASQNMFSPYIIGLLADFYGFKYVLKIWLR